MPNDGVQDVASWGFLDPSAVDIYGTPGPGVSIRPVGLGGTVVARNTETSESCWSYVGTDTYNLWDYTFNNDMSVGETYGNGAGETGLWAYPRTTPSGANSSFWFAPSSSHTFAGERYNILAVPESSTLTGLLVAGFLLRRRKRG